MYGSLPNVCAGRQEKLFGYSAIDPGFSFERRSPESWSVRITQGYRAVGKESDSMLWYWIGSHSDFDKKFRA